MSTLSHRGRILRRQRVRPRSRPHLRVIPDVVEHRAPLGFWRTVALLAFVGCAAAALAACAVVAWFAKRGGW